MAVPGVALLVPKFLIVTYLGIYDTYTAMILPLIVDAAGVFIMKQFFDSVPVSIEEAARMDGASVFRTFWSVVLPMARPALITLTILSFQGSWNEFSHFLVTTQSPEKRTLVTGLASLTSGERGCGTQFPLEAGRCVPHHHPCGVVVLRLPAPLRPRRQRGRRQGLTAAAVPGPPVGTLDGGPALRSQFGPAGEDGGDVGDGAARGEQVCPLSPAARASGRLWPRRRCSRWRPSSRRPTPHRPYRPPASTDHLRGRHRRQPAPFDHTSSREARRVDRVPTPKLGWYPCYGNAECATTRLPLDYDHPHGAKTLVAVLRVKAKDQKHRIGSLFVNPGGPGGSGTGLAQAAPYFLGAGVLARFDVVGIDPRGTNFSDQVACFPGNAQQGRALSGLNVAFPFTKAEERAAVASSRGSARRAPPRPAALGLDVHRRGGP